MSNPSQEQDATKLSDNIEPSPPVSVSDHIMRLNVLGETPLPQIQPQALENAQARPRLGMPPAGLHARRGSSKRVSKIVGEAEIEPPFPWATSRPAVIHTLTYLSSKNIDVITGQVYCRSCDKTVTLEYNLREKFAELSRIIRREKGEMRHRAEKFWMNPNLTPCDTCESGMSPVISSDLKGINWLFLLLGQMLGCCTLTQLRYFCERTSQHRTGAKDRVVYLTYLGLCKQLQPTNRMLCL